jgi:hypothetical protein
MGNPLSETEESMVAQREAGIEGGAERRSGRVQRRMASGW